jgi:prepilin-type N-terminal cleavage/methylation domain-containing protein
MDMAALRFLVPRRPDSDRGFGIAEVLVAMFLLGIIAIAVLPLLVQGLRLSVTNATIAAATQLANQQVEQVRGATACSSVAAATTTTTVRNVTLQGSRTIGTTCPSLATSYPTTVRVSVSVKRTDTNAVLATANTLVFVTGP